MKYEAKILAVVLGIAFTAQSLNAATFKPRLVVLTDIAPDNVEPDDGESMIRFLAYPDRFKNEAEDSPKNK